MSPLADDERIIEGVMTTVAPATADAPTIARVNIAPMGPIVNAACTRFVLRPFKTSTTYQNLKATGEGVFHVTDDALLIARGAIGRVDPATVCLRPATAVTGLVLADCCRRHELRVVELDDSHDRVHIVAEAVHSESVRDFLGFNRARHAVIEAAILATRLHLTGAEPVLAELDRLQVPVDKTGAAAEHEAMRLLRDYVTTWRDAAP